MADLTRRAFLGKTLLTGATIAVGGLSTTSTTPVKPVATATATTWKNLNVLSPKAKAYRSFLRGISASAGFGKVNRKSLITPERTYTARTQGHDKNQAVRYDKSPGRRAFETAIKKPRKTSTWEGEKFGRNSRSDRIRGLNNPGARKIAQKIAPIPPNTTNPAIRGDYHNAQKGLTAKMNQDARSIYAKELRSASQHKEGEKMYKKKRRGYGGGGGKHMIDGVETPRNPTGMSLLNRKSILM